MKEEIDIQTGETWIQLSDEEIKFGFLSQCIEAVAETLNCNYVEMLDRMEAANMTEGYILAHYDALHTQSFQNIVAELIELLQKRETKLRQ